MVDYPSNTGEIMATKLETLDDLIEQHTKVVVENFSKDSDTLQVIIGYSGTKRYLLPLNFADDREKEIVLRMVTMLFAAYNVKRYTFATEAYALKLPNNEDSEKEYEKLRKEGKRISDHPNSVEILLVGAVSYGDKKLRVFDILKDRSGLGPSEEGQAAGRFTELLPPQDLPEHVREEARKILDKFGVEFKSEDIIQ